MREMPPIEARTEDETSPPDSSSSGSVVPPLPTISPNELDRASERRSACPGDGTWEDGPEIHS